MGKRRFYPNRKNNAGERRSLSLHTGNHKGYDCAGLGCGDGTTAIPEAKLGAKVLGVEIAKNIVEAGNNRALAEGLSNTAEPQKELEALFINESRAEIITLHPYATYLKVIVKR